MKATKAVAKAEFVRGPRASSPALRVLEGRGSGLPMASGKSSSKAGEDTRGSASGGCPALRGAVAAANSPGRQDWLSLRLLIYGSSIFGARRAKRQAFSAEIPMWLRPSKLSYRKFVSLQAPEWQSDAEKSLDIAPVIASC